jgi:hypothetical protein
MAEKNLIQILDDMGVEVEESIMNLNPRCTPYDLVNRGCFKASAIMERVLKHGYESMGRYFGSELDQKTNEALKKYGADNVYVLEQTMLAGVPQVCLPTEPGLAYVVVKENVLKNYKKQELISNAK